MADGGATSFIMLVTALLVAGSVSTFLIAEWGDVARSMEMERRAQAIDAETDVSLAGDPGNVRYSLTGQMQFYLMNSGTAVLDEGTMLVLVDGVQQTSNGPPPFSTAAIGPQVKWCKCRWRTTRSPTRTTAKSW